jgi:hypothetical protein
VSRFGKTVSYSKDNESDVHWHGDYSGTARYRGNVSMVGLDCSRRRDKRRTRTREYNEVQKKTKDKVDRKRKVWQSGIVMVGNRMGIGVAGMEAELEM